MKRKGFTLVELLAVIVILGILMTIAIPTVNRTIKHAEKTSLYNYANKVIQELSTELMLHVDDLTGTDIIEGVGVISSLEGLGLNTNGQYQGYIIYNTETDEILVYIHDGKNMITAFKDNDTRKVDEVVKKYNKEEAESLINHKAICNSQTNLNFCIYDTPEGRLSFDVNHLPGAAIMASIATFGYIDLSIGYSYEEATLKTLTNANIAGDVMIHNIIRKLAKPSAPKPHHVIGSQSNTWIDTVKHVKVVNTNTYTVPAGAVNINPIYNGENISELPVYLWFNSGDSTLYFGSPTGEIDIYFDAQYLFALLSNLETVEFEKFNFHYVTMINEMFAMCKKIQEIDFSNKSFSLVRNAEAAFLHCESLVGNDKNAPSPVLSFNDWNTEYLEGITYMFSNCWNLRYIDVSRWSLEKVENLSYLFTGCGNLVSLDVSNWDLGKAETLSSMFQGCEKLPYLNVSRWNVSRVQVALRLFNYCINLNELDVSNWDTRSLRDARNMFLQCTKITELDLSNWDVSNIESIWQMFDGDKNLKVIKFGRTKNNKVLVSTLFSDTPEDQINWSEQYETVWHFIGGCTSLEYLDMSNFNKFPYANDYGYSNYNLKTFLVSSSFPDEDDDGIIKIGNYTLTKVSS